MGRKRIYHTDEAKTEAQRRNRMKWYDRNRKKILKAYKIRKINEETAQSGSRSSMRGPKSVAVALPDGSEQPPVLTNDFRKHSETSTTSNKDAMSPQMLLGNVNEQKRRLDDFMRGDSETFCIRVANEIVLASKDEQLGVIQVYLDSVASFIDGSRPYTKALWHKFGMIPEWKEARAAQSSMLAVMEYLDEIHHRVEGGDLAEAVSLNLLSFQ